MFFIFWKCGQPSPWLGRLAITFLTAPCVRKTSAENEVFLLKRGSSGSSEGRRRRSIPHRITHSASDTACNRGETTKPEAKKRRSMSDYLDMKSEKQSTMLKEKANLRKNQIHKQPCNDFEQKTGQTPAVTGKEESN